MNAVSRGFKLFLLNSPISAASTLAALKGDETMVDVSSYTNKSKTDRRRNSFHLVFVPKYRYKMFQDPFKRELLREFFKGIASKYNIGIHAMEAAADHVHLFVELPMNMSIGHAIRLLKALSAKCMFQAFPGFRKRYPKGHFWNGYAYYESIGQVTASKIQKYIERSQTKHDEGKHYKRRARNSGRSTSR